MRCTGKLAFVNVLVTLLTLCLRDLKNRLFTLRALRYMAFGASNRHMAAFERVFCCRMIFDSKGRRFESFYGMARRTFATVSTSAELAFVRILVAVHAFRKRHRRFKVPVRVAVAARD